MSPSTITLLFLLFAVVMFVLEKIPLGVTSMIVCIGLVVTGVLDVKTAFAGVIDSNVILFVAMFIVGGALFETGMANIGHKKHIIVNMRSIENRLQLVIKSLAVYLSGKEIERDVWSDICTLEKDIQHCIKDAYEYQNNTFHSHPEYYIAYFEMRHNQCQILHNLHYEMKKIRTVPAQAGIVAEYMLYLTGFINECNHPSCQMNKLHEIFNILKTEDLPKTREEFENRALVYHIMMDIEDFLKYKIRFINELDEAKMKIYWKNK